MLRQRLPILIILLLAVVLRLAFLTAIPPGLTHDEANHGRDAIGVLDGVLLFYFPLNYGSEPLYGYVVAANMLLFGENLLALRLVNVFCGLLAIALTYRWARRRLGHSTALAGATLLAVSFWPLATSRQALRAGMLPLLMVAAVVFFWQILDHAGREGNWRGFIGPVAGFGLAVALTLHDYLAARVL